MADERSRTRKRKVRLTGSNSPDVTLHQNPVDEAGKISKLPESLDDVSSKEDSLQVNEQPAVLTALPLDGLGSISPLAMLLPKFVQLSSLVNLVDELSDRYVVLEEKQGAEVDDGLTEDEKLEAEMLREILFWHTGSSRYSSS